MTLYLATDARLRDEKDDRLLPHQILRPRQTGKNPSKGQAAEAKALGAERAGSRAKRTVVKTRHVITGILPCVRSTSQRDLENLLRRVHFLKQMTRTREVKSNHEFKHSRPFLFF